MFRTRAANLQVGGAVYDTSSQHVWRSNLIYY